MRPILVMPPAPHCTEDAVWHCVRGGSDQVIHSTEAPPADPHHDTVLIVPGAALSWLQVSLPPGLLTRTGAPRNAAKLRAVLEGLLEDQVLDEPAQLHFALQQVADTAGPQWVAICANAWLEDVLRTLAQAGHRVVRIVPEWAPDTASPTAQAVWLVTTGSGAELVWCDASGVHRRLAPAEHLGNAPPPSGWPSEATMFAEPGCARLAEEWLHTPEVTVTQQAQRMLACLDHDWNLAQGAFATRNPWMQRLKETTQHLWTVPAWRPARWALGLLLVVQLAGLNMHAWQARNALAAQRVAIDNIYLATFPGNPVVVDAPLQMQRGVDALVQRSGQAQARDMERMLEAWGAAAADASPTSVDFAAGELRLGGVTQDQQALQSITQALRTAGYRLQANGDTVVITP